MVDVSTLESLALENKDLQAPSPQDSISRQVLLQLDSWKSAFVLRAHPLWRAWAPLFAGPELSPEHVQWIEAREALEQGDADPFWRFVERFLEVSPDQWLRGVLESFYLPHGGDVPTPIMLELLRHHKQRLRSRDGAEWYADRLAAKVESCLDKSLGHELMRSLESYGRTRIERLEGLRENLPGALIRAEANGYYFTEGIFRNELLREVEQLIVSENRLLRETRKREENEEGSYQYKIVSLTWFVEDAGILTDEDALGSYVGVEDELLLDSLIARSGLSETQLEVLNLSRQGLPPEQIALRLDVTRSTVDVHIHNIHHKLRSAS